MKRNKKILLALGSMATVIAPIASAVSMSTNVTNRQATVTQAQWQAFYAAVNDKTNETNLKTEWEAVKLKFTTSEFYKERINLQNGVWDVQDKIDLYSTLFSLLGDNRAGFTDAEKVTIAKYIINNEAVADAFEAFGFDPRKSTDTNAIKAVQGNLFDPTKSTNSPLTTIDYNSSNSIEQTILLKGATGINKDYHPNTYHDIQLEVSNEDALKYYISVIARTEEWDTMRDKVAIAEDDVLVKPTIKEALAPMFDEITKFNNTISTSTTTVDKISTVSLFNIFQNIDLNSASDDLAAFTMIMNSNFGKALYGVDGAKAKLDSFTKAASGSTHRKVLADGVVSDVITRLDSIETVNSDQLEYLTKNGIDLDYNNIPGRIDSLLSFAKVILDKSDLFTKDVQFRSRTSILGNHSISVKGDFNTAAWTDLSNSDLIVPRWTLADDLLKIGVEFEGHPLESSLLPKPNIQTTNTALTAVDINSSWINGTLPANYYYSYKFQIKLTLENGAEEVSNVIYSGYGLKDGFSTTIWANPTFYFSNNKQLLTSSDKIQPLKITKATIVFNSEGKEMEIQIADSFVKEANDSITKTYNLAKVEKEQVQIIDPNAPVEFSVNLKSIYFKSTIIADAKGDNVSAQLKYIENPQLIFDYDIVQNPSI